MTTIHSMDVVLPVKHRKTLRLRLVGKPEKLATQLLARMKLKLPTRPRMLQNVVENQPPKSANARSMGRF